MKIQAKLINHITLNGRKETGEKNLVKGFKKLQKNYKKKTHEIFQLAIIYSISIFKIHKVKNKKNKTNEFKEIPGFIKNNKTRTSLAIKTLLLHTNTQNEAFAKKLTKEILITSKNKGNNVEKKNEVQKNILNQKHFFRYYKWK